MFSVVIETNTPTPTFFMTNRLLLKLQCNTVKNLFMIEEALHWMTQLSKKIKQCNTSNMILEKYKYFWKHRPLFHSCAPSRFPRLNTPPLLFLDDKQNACKHVKTPKGQDSWPGGRRSFPSAVRARLQSYDLQSSCVQDNDVIVARAKRPATGDEQTVGKQSHTRRLGD